MKSWWNKAVLYPTLTTDVPPDVPYENYLYYLENKKAMLGY
ncbi:hypothetical protein [Caldicellulosiruptor changbaiensis]|nr:hypothetical protein [Caldicellulosiruptor changbaiensis]